MKTSNARTRVLLVVLVIVAAYVLLWRPLASKSAEATERRSAAEATLSQVQAELAVAAVEPAEDEPDPGAEARLRAVPAEPELSALLRSLDGLAVQTGLELASIMPSSPTDFGDGVGQSVQILVTGEGTRAAAYAFVSGLQAFERLVVVEQLDLADQAAADDTTPAGVQLQLSLRAFVATGTASGAGTGSDPEASPASD
jgi:Tfp pilus assembly protein PilO